MLFVGGCFLTETTLPVLAATMTFVSRSNRPFLSVQSATAQMGSDFKPMRRYRIWTHFGVKSSCLRAIAIASLALYLAPLDAQPFVARNAAARTAASRAPGRAAGL